MPTVIAEWVPITFWVVGSLLAVGLVSICYEGVEDEVQVLLFMGYHRLKDYDPQRATWYAQCKKTYPTQAGISTIDCIHDE